MAIRFREPVGQHAVNALLDRVRRAVGDRYEVGEEIARGGMGAVFVGHDPRLDCRVAIKVLLPEIATASMAGRFLQEARIMARVKHPNVVPIHEADEHDGLYYYVMDFVEGPTLADRLLKGPLTASQMLRLTRNLLVALEAVHAHNVVHRDIKPANVFLVGDRAVLADFGIAKSLGPDTDQRTVPGHQPGTPDYMAPEQLAGLPVTPRTDLYATAMLAYEGMTGRKWPKASDPKQGEWAGVPRGMSRALARALAVAPEDRWPDASSFRRRLERLRIRPYQWRAALLAVAGVALGVAAGFVLRRPSTPLPATGLVIRVDAVAFDGPSAVGWLADSVPNLYVRLLDHGPDFRLCVRVADCPSPTVVLRNVVRADSTTFRLRVEMESAREIREIHASDSSELGQWRVVVDRASDAALRRIWMENSPLRDWLPLDVLPETDEGYEAWFVAERFLSRAQWSQARDAFVAAYASDTTCLLCSWRITEIQRWLVEPPDPRHVALLRNGAARFPPHYRALLGVRWTSMRERLESLTSATRQWPAFPYTWFLLGEELFHRGPLVGRSRAEALPAFRRAAQLAPTFGPAWEHLAWASAAEGDAAAARQALDRYNALLQDAVMVDDFASVMQALLALGIGWRFAPDVAARGAAQTLRDPRLLTYPDIAAGPRLLASFETGQGMIELADMIGGGHPDPTVQFAVRMARVLALVGRGRIAQARTDLQDLIRSHPAADALPVFAAKLDATLVLLDSSGVTLDRDRVRDVLAANTLTLPADRGRRAGAAWLRALLDGPDAALIPDAMAIIVRARRSNDPRTALEATGPEHVPLIAETMDSTVDPILTYLPDPFYRTILKFSRAGWLAAVGDTVGAANELRFHEALDLAGRPVGMPEAGEIDWAFGTLARWRRARLLHSGGRLGDVCRAYEVVTARWAGGDPVFRARADTAAAASAELQCPAPLDVGW